MLKKVLTILFLCSACFDSYSQKNKTELYIDKYKDLAIDEMNNYGIPASITLSQGILESGNGESMLAIEANNHFGIKCHKQWEGERIYADDDEEGECFRKYPTVFASYRDHSLFLSERERYATLFDLSPKDYQRWAKGLKKAGYATNPDYAKKLIKIIKRHNLNQYDIGSTISDINSYFGNTFGLPFGYGIGGYWFNKKSLYALELQSAIWFTQLKLGYHYNIMDKLYIGAGLGGAYFSAFELLCTRPNSQGENSCMFSIRGANHPFLSVSPELIYRINRKKKSDILLRAGYYSAKIEHVEIIGLKLKPQHSLFLPFVNLTFLISAKDEKEGNGSWKLEF